MVGSGPAEFDVVVGLFHSALFCTYRQGLPFSLFQFVVYITRLVNILAFPPSHSNMHAGHDREGLVLVPAGNSSIVLLVLSPASPLTSFCWRHATRLATT